MKQTAVKPLSVNHTFTIGGGKGIFQLADNRKQLYVLQRKAWSATRPLGQVASYGPIPQGNNHQHFNPLNANTENHDFGNLSLNHRHIIFSRNYRKLPGGPTDNIGFHSANGGPLGQGVLFSENWKGMGYRERQQLTNNYSQDQRLIAAINQNNPPGPYNILTHNCQDWVDKVISDM